jgi:hypothetical protein
MPHEVGRKDAEGIRGPAADQVRPPHRNLHDVGAAPVVADEVDRPPELLQTGNQPIAISVDGRLEALGCGDAEPRRGEREGIDPAQLRQQRPPHRGVLRVAVDEDQGGAVRHRYSISKELACMYASNSGIGSPRTPRS